MTTVSVQKFINKTFTSVRVQHSANDDDATKIVAAIVRDGQGDCWDTDRDADRSIEVAMDVGKIVGYEVHVEPSVEFNS